MGLDNISGSRITRAGVPGGHRPARSIAKALQSCARRGRVVVFVASYFSSTDVSAKVGKLGIEPRWPNVVGGLPSVHGRAAEKQYFGFLLICPCSRRPKVLEILVAISVKSSGAVYIIILCIPIHVLLYLTLSPYPEFHSSIT